MAEDMRQRVQSQLSRLLGCEHVALTRRGNTAIKEVLKYIKHHTARDTVLIPDQGGWITFQQFPRDLKLNLEYVPTQDGVPDHEALRKQAHERAVLLYENPAGYFASLDMGAMYEVCQEVGALCIADVTGSIGDTEVVVGDCADIIVCSFGGGKVVNLGYGGCIAFHNPQLSFISDFDEAYLDDLYEHLRAVPQRLSRLHEASAAVKRDLGDYKVIHPDRRGIVVVVAFENTNEKQDIIDYCTRQGYEYTECPRYIRVQRPAISIELKRFNGAF